MVDVVFVPGLLCTADLFAAQRTALGDAHAISIGEHHHDDTLSAVAARILENAPDRFIYAGLSMGGYIGFEMMRQAPGRFEAFILLNTSARADTAEQTERRKALIEIARTEGMDALSETLLPAFLGETNLGREDLRTTVRKMARDTGAEAYLTQQAAIMSRADSREMLRGIDVPTLVIVGAHDTLTPPELSREIAQGIPGAELVVIDDCGHLSTIEQPEAVNDAIRSFLDARL